MKVKVNNQELYECLINGIGKAIRESRETQGSFEKAMKSANRDIERDTFGDGFKSYNKVHKSQKDYSRKGKNKFNKNNYMEIDEASYDYVSPYDSYTDDGYEIETPDISDIVGREFKGEPQTPSKTVVFKTDIDKSEAMLIDNILEHFEDAEYDVIDGEISFIVPVSLKKHFVSHLRDQDVEFTIVK